MTSDKERLTAKFMTPETTSQPEPDHDQQHTQQKRVREDLLALGIDIDFHVIGRMQKLGLSQTWSTTSKVASSLRKRNPYGVPSSVAYQNLDDRGEHVENPDRRELEKEWSRVDQQKLHLALQELNNRDSPFPSSSRVKALKLVQLFKTQYNRSADKFVSSMLAQTNKKGLIRAGQLMKTRFVLHSNFSEIIIRLHKQASPDAILVLFTLLADDTEINGRTTKVIDLKAFILMLKIATDDTRRSFDDKTSKIANEVEFWNQNRREIPSGGTNVPNPKGRKPANDSFRGEVHTSKGKLHEEYRPNNHIQPGNLKNPRKTRSDLYPRARAVGAVVGPDLSNPLRIKHSVAELMGTENRDAAHKVGRGVKGSFEVELRRGNRSVAASLNSREYEKLYLSPKRRLPFDHTPKPQYSDPYLMKTHMQAGTGVSSSLNCYLSNCNSRERATSFNHYYSEGVNETNVPQALHFSARV